MKKVFYCDFDGIITKSKKRLVELYNLYYKPVGLPFMNHENCDTWTCEMPPNDVDSIFKRSDFFSKKLELHDGAKEGLEMLKGRGYELILYSKGSIENLGNKVKWVDKNLNGIFDGWVFSGSNDLKMVKNQLDMSVNKNDGFSILFDDCYTNLTCEDGDPFKHHMSTYSICGKLSSNLLEEWNIKFTNEKYIANSWKDLEGIIDMIERYELNIIR